MVLPWWGPGFSGLSGTNTWLREVVTSEDFLTLDPEIYS